MTTEHEAALQVTQLLWKLENELDTAFATAGAPGMSLPLPRGVWRWSGTVGGREIDL